MNVKWLHLSDIHFLFKNYQTNFMRSDFISKLKSHSDFEKFDYVFLTGDITNQGGDYTPELIKFLDDLLASLNLDRSRLFIVPGNHDLDMAVVDNKTIKSLKTDSILTQNIIEKFNDEKIEKIVSAQAKYFDFYKEVKGVDYPKSAIHFTETVDKTNITHLNTSWLNGISGNEGLIYIGIDKLFKELSRLSPNPDQLNIVIGHHGLECFAKVEREQLKSIFKNFNIDFYLSGHFHEAIVNYDTHVDTHYCVCRHLKDDGLPGGYAIGKIDTEYGDNYIEFRTWNSERGYWTIDNNVGHSAPDGRYSINTLKFPSNPKGSPFVAIHKTMTLPESPTKLIEAMKFGKVNSRIYPFSNLTIESKELWLEHKEHTYHFAQEIMNQIKDEVLHLFPLSQIPLLIYLGHVLQNDSKICIYQKNESQDWVQDDSNAPSLQVKVQKKDSLSRTRKLIVLIEASGKISEEDVDVHISTTGNDLIRIFIDDPDRYSVLYKSQILEFKNILRKTVESIASTYDEIHMFAAVPAGLAVEIGRTVLKSMWPAVHLYNFRNNDKPKYTHTFSIND